MKRKFKKRYVFLPTIIILIIYLFWGPLFPWSPVKPGFHKIETTLATVFIQNMAEDDSLVHHINSIMQEEEAFHGLKFREKVTIIILDEESSMKRFLPWMRGSGFSVSLSMVHLIYIGPTARKSVYGYEVYLKHELSHELIRQYMTTENSFEMQEQGWLAEGIATYYGGPDYFSREELVKLCEMKGISLNSLNESHPLEIPDGEIKIRYTFYRYFIEYLIKTYGLEKFQLYLKKYIENPHKYKDLFHEVFNEDLLSILNGFELYISS